MRRSALASTLLAGLELGRDGAVTLEQAVPFGPLTIARATTGQRVAAA